MILKNYFLFFLCLQVFLQPEIPSEATFLTDSVYVIFPDSDVMREEIGSINTVIHVKMTDSIQYYAAVSTSQSPIIPDSVSKVNGFDANLYQFASVQFGYDLEATEIKIDGVPATSFKFLSKLDGLDEVSAHRGVLIYHSDQLIIIDCTNEIGLEAKVSAERIRFLESIGIN